MNTTELVEHISEEHGISRVQAKKIIKTVFNAIMSSVKEDTDVRLTGFGTFFRHSKKARPGRNPKTGEPVAIPAQAVPKFKPGKIFKEFVK